MNVLCYLILNVINHEAVTTLAIAESVWNYPQHKEYRSKYTHDSLWQVTLVTAEAAPKQH